MTFSPELPMSRIFQAYKRKTEAAKKEYLKALAAYRASLVSKVTQSPRWELATGEIVKAGTARNSWHHRPQTSGTCASHPGSASCWQEALCVACFIEFLQQEGPWGASAVSVGLPIWVALLTQLLTMSTASEALFTPEAQRQGVGLRPQRTQNIFLEVVTGK